MSVERRNLNNLRRENGIYPLFNFLGFFQIPFHLVNFSMILSMSRDLAHPNHADLASSSFLWITNPCLADPIGGLPLIFTGLTYFNARIAISKMAGMDPMTTELFTKFLKYLPWIGLPVQLYLPAANVMYTICLSSFNLFIQLCLKMGPIRRKFDLKDK